MGARQAIVVDWGTTSFRAWLVDLDTAERLGEIPSGRGMKDVAAAEYPAYCHAMLSRWRERPDPPPVYMAGMVGAPTGWLFAPQPPLPVSAADLAAQVVAAPGLPDAWIIPGCRVDTADPDRVDVMRGEEVQIFGALALLDRRDGILCLPGTHSKWATVEDGRITDFHTFMTGEMYRAALDATILGQGVPASAPWDEAAFLKGLEAARQPGGLLNRLFTARGRRLYRDLGPEAVPSYLSGLLIGEEFRAAAEMAPSADPVPLIGAEPLRRPYEAAARAFGRAKQWVPAADATVRGCIDVIRQRP
ncbi:2-dehydro-3-deoxygalactonokinase [Caenispirillum salinarum AK4]|uniref:2-dehydro-3-deoxygalactonokinase n=1 Tax=Caenispirillum salinarum AK4 TaxID=1238182 RepID=K9HJ09_9PROT|nr:2-dehydro-3-deoxygalactonokinase [Caenispirillum salinarum]EKV28586.1 2-dehydro-3-deoxygalactonokinase [Caenispirillum salinarum AK4]